jgi:hypothetical protein
VHRQVTAKTAKTSPINLPASNKPKTTIVIPIMTEIFADHIRRFVFFLEKVN